MEASAGGREVAVEEYLMLWMGAMGRCVGLEVPFAVASVPLVG
jgi:ubiquitin-like-conjugating enzyme ATG10